MEKKQCHHCKQSFEPNHGNRIYCSDKCYLTIKLGKQTENNQIMKQCRTGFLKNYRYFQELLPEPGKQSVALIRLLKKGFDQDAFYGTAIDKNEMRWHSVNEYMFNIIKKDGQLILNLYKP